MSSAADEIRHKSLLRRLSLNPWTVLIALALGVLAGVAVPVIAPALGYVSKIYLIVLNMCVAPILVALLTTSVGRLMSLPSISQFLWRTAFFFPVGMLAVSAVSVLAAMALGPGRALDQGSLAALGIVVNDMSSALQVTLGGTVEAAKSPDLVQIVGKVIPDNVFAALDEGNSLQIVFAAIVFGAALGFLTLRAKETVFDFMDGMYAGFRSILDHALLLLPLAVFCIVASEAAKLNVSTITAMGRFILEAIVVLIAVSIAGSAIVAQRSRTSLLEVLDRQRSVAILALTSRNSFACLPSAVTSLQALGFDLESCEMLVPLAITLCRVGSIAYFAFAAVFVIELYNTPLTVTTLIVVIVASVFAGVATAGISGIPQLTFIGMALNAVNVPFEAALVLFIAVDTLVDPFRTLVTVNLGITIASLVGRSKGASTVAVGSVGTLQEGSLQPT